MKRKRLLIFCVLILLSVSFSSCAPAEYELDKSGFLAGIWHGFIFAFSLLGKLFGIDIGLYAINNTGAAYWAGYVIGIGAFGVSATAGKIPESGR